MDKAAFGLVEESKLLFSILLEFGVFENDGVVDGFDEFGLFGGGQLGLFFYFRFFLFFLLLLLLFLFLFLLLFFGFGIFLVLFALFFLPFEGFGVDRFVLFLRIFAHFANSKIYIIYFFYIFLINQSVHFPKNPPRFSHLSTSSCTLLSSQLRGTPSPAPESFLPPTVESARSPLSRKCTVPSSSHLPSSPFL